MSAAFRPSAAEPVTIWAAVETGRALADDEQAVADTLTAWLTEVELMVFAEAVALAFRQAGPPVPPLLDDIREEARLWASWASAAERRAYMAACWHRLSEKDRSAFLRAAPKVPA